MSQTIIGMRLPFTCWGWISTEPVLTTETDRTGPVERGLPCSILGPVSVSLPVMVFSHRERTHAAVQSRR
jgi:hypothetical protein